MDRFPPDASDCIKMRSEYLVDAVEIRALVGRLVVQRHLVFC
jgi:hypothetical protein